MSAMMTISGEKIDISDLKPLELIEASEAQAYIRNLESALIKEDGGPVYLVHDGETETSDMITSDAREAYWENNTFSGTILLELINRLVKNGNSFRI